MYLLILLSKVTELHKRPFEEFFDFLLRLGFFELLEYFGFAIRDLSLGERRGRLTFSVDSEVVGRSLVI